MTGKIKSGKNILVKIYPPLAQRQQASLLSSLNMVLYHQRTKPSDFLHKIYFPLPRPKSGVSGGNFLIIKETDSLKNHTSYISISYFTMTGSQNKMYASASK